jgi:SPP1 family predicted phage head-tail adaptor
VAVQGDALMAGAGRMDRRITFQTFTEARDSFGEPIKTWANLASVPTVWARVSPLSGREVFAGDQILGVADVEFEIRYRSDITVEMRVVYANENYDILSTQELGRLKGLRVMARKVAL